MSHIPTTLQTKLHAEIAHESSAMCAGLFPTESQKYAPVVGLLIIFPRNNCFTSIECEEVAPVGCVITGTAAGAVTGTIAGTPALANGMSK